MKIEQIRKRLKRNRPSKTLSLRIPADALDDLARVAAARGFSTPQALARAYVGQALSADLERLEGGAMTALVQSLRRHGISEKVINKALNEAGALH